MGFQGNSTSLCFSLLFELLKTISMYYNSNQKQIQLFSLEKRDN